MANYAYYELHVYGEREDVERFQRIMKGVDDEYVIPVNDESESYNELIDIGDGLFRMEFFGEVKWGSEFLSESGSHNRLEPGNKLMITWLDASKLFRLTMEWYCEECGSGFNEYFSVANGMNLRRDATYWSAPTVFDNKDHQANIDDFEDEVDSALSHGVSLDMSQVEGIRANDYEHLEKLDRFSFGGYRWDTHSLLEIKEMIEPRILCDVRRL